MIKYWKQWRAWTEQRMKDYEKQLLEGVIDILKEPDFASDGTRAKYIIDYVRDMDGGEKPW